LRLILCALLFNVSLGPGATQFTQRRWEELTVQIQTKVIVKDLVLRTKMFFGWIERNFVFAVLVDCALAQLIAVGRIATSEIFVFSRAIEDAVDMALMRSRSEAELARMVTQINNLKELSTVWDEAKSRNLLNCNLAPPAVTKDSAGAKSLIVVRNLHYSRGTATVRADHLELKAGTYALTGPNGSGKSTLFRVLMSCKTNERSIDLPTSITLSTPAEPFIEEDDLERELACEDADAGSEEADIGADGTIDTAGRKLAEIAKDIHPRLSITMPSSHVVEISQTFYWPLYSKPIDWIYQDHVTETRDEEELQKRVRRVAEELHSLQFTQTMGNDQEEAVEADSDSEVIPVSSSDDAIKGIMNDLLEEKEDWFGDLSGGQKSKVELVRKVFLHDECPHVLLVDETMAPLDPTSKSLVMAKLKKFCSASVVIVIYHSDVGREHDGGEGEMVECVPSNDFFDGNIHVENRVIQLRPIC
jgi:energy-coupling factor transporter ATP-binding protein EcfA2